MNLHEYQGKLLLKKFGVAVPDGTVAESPEGAVEAAKVVYERTGTDKWVVKAQVHAGGRGKGGGIKIANSYDEVKEISDQIIGMQLVTPQTGPQGKKVRKVLIEQNIFYKGESQPREFYMSVLLNRKKERNTIMYSPRGGMDIEQVAKESPGDIFTEEIDPVIGIMPFQCRRVAFNLGLKGPAYKSMVAFVERLYMAYIGNDASLFEINPVFKTSDHRIMAADAKVVIDNNALFRHPGIAAMRDIEEEDPVEVAASRFDLSYIKLSGNVGCMVNGAGLAMATMDIIKLSGGEPANFLDVGGSADTKRVEEAFRIILKDPHVKAILVNIFGGIVRCDSVATGIIEACKNIGDISIPIIIRLQGTNAAEGKRIIDNAGLRVHSAILLKEAAQLVNAVLK
jgi:succinyl-CoA synthetase beta subunit